MNCKEHPPDFYLLTKKQSNPAFNIFGMKKANFFLVVLAILSFSNIFATEYYTNRCSTETFSSTSILHKIISPVSSPNVPQTYYGDNGKSWTYWLGGGNHEAFPNDSAMYIRARLSTETCDFGYLQSDSISGGISALSFIWKQGGVESITYDIAIIVNNDTVGRINKAGLSTYTASTAIPDTFRLSNINIEGKFVLKIENRTYYNGTSNKGRIILDSLTWCCYDTSAVVINYISGYVKTNTGNPIANAVVSDGYSVVKTGATGYYSFPRNERTEFVFISVPETYEIPMGSDGSPSIFARVNESGDFSCNFTLVPFADGGLADFNHVMIGISDPQVRRDYETWRFRNETIKDINELKSTYPAGTKFYGVVVGDLVWDDYGRMEEHKASVAQLEFPVFNVIGNHDHDLTKCGDIESDHYFKAAFGPTYYSFNRGNIHYVMMDNIDYIGCNTKNYNHNITQNQIDWLIKDLAQVPADKTIVLSVHAPMHGSSVINRQTVYNLMGGRRNIQHIIAGHHHTLSNNEINTRLYEHVLVSANGAQWSGDIASDGTPNGYGVFEAGDKGFNNWYFKATGKARDYQFATFPIGSIDTGNGKSDFILANVWNYDSKWSVNIYEDGVKKVMQQFSGIDPKAYDFLALDGDTRPNYPGGDGGTTVSQNPGYSSTSHMFSYKPTNPNAECIVEVTDRAGNTYTQKVLKNMMVAAFKQEEDTFVYRQDFNTLQSYPNHLLTDKTAKGTFVPGHVPDGWYATTSGTVRPTGTVAVNWSTFNYMRVNNGDQNIGWLYSYGEGNSAIATQNSTERSLGSLISSTHRCIQYGVLVENNTGKYLKGLEINYDGKMWRAGTAPSVQHKLSFSYALNPDAKAIRERSKWISQVTTTAIDSLSFFTPVNNTATQQAKVDIAIDGNLPNNQTKVNGRINIDIAPGEVVLLRWEDVDDSGNDHGMAIDNLVVKAIEVTPNATDLLTEDLVMFYNTGNILHFPQAPDNETLTVYDVTGCIIHQQQVSTSKVDLTGIAGNGIYIIRVGNKVKKIVF